MTHFLARLVERARGTALLVEPIIAPRFAPAPAGLAEVASETEAPPPAQSEPHLPVAEKSGDREKVVRREKIEPARPAAETTERLVEPAREDLLVSPAMTVPEPPIVLRQTESEIETTLGQVSAKEDFLIPQVARPPSYPRWSATRPGSSPPVTAGHQASAGVESARIAPNESKAEAPIVRVTIGRIEVRASAPPTPAPSRKPKAAPPLLTLDGYLKERKEGRQ